MTSFVKMPEQFSEGLKTDSTRYSQPDFLLLEIEGICGPYILLHMKYLI